MGHSKHKKFSILKQSDLTDPSTHLGTEDESDQEADDRNDDQQDSLSVAFPEIWELIQ